MISVLHGRVQTELWDWGLSDPPESGRTEGIHVNRCKRVYMINMEKPKRKTTKRHQSAPARAHTLWLHSLNVTHPVCYHAVAIPGWNYGPNSGCDAHKAIKV